VVVEAASSRSGKKQGIFHNDFKIDLKKHGCAR
jgi:hypothetical protein